MTIGEPTMTQAEIQRWERALRDGEYLAQKQERMNAIIKQERPVPPKPKPRANHPHRWRVEEPGGPTSRGVCECGAEREFANAFVLDREGGNANAMRQNTNYIARKGQR